MNTKEYIESGILEAYVLGAVSEEERLHIEVAIAQYPDVAAEVAAIEETMFAVAQAGAVAPPPHMQQQIWNVLDTDAHAGFIPPGGFEPEAHTQTIPLTPPPADTVVVSSGPTWQRAAVWAAFLTSLLTNILLLSQRNESKKQNDLLAAKVDSMNIRQQALASRIDMYEHERDMLVDTGMKTVVMRSMKPGHNEMAGMVFMDKTQGIAYLSLHHMPMPPQGKQYQLWVIKDGKPVDMGVIPNDMVASNGMQKIAGQMTGGQAFAISLEKEGGSPVPTMEQIYVMGGV